MLLYTKTISCPHCGHHQHVDIDASTGDQDYYHDCRVCCNPIHLQLHLDEYQKKIEIFVGSDDEQYY